MTRQKRQILPPRPTTDFFVGPHFWPSCKCNYKEGEGTGLRTARRPHLGWASKTCVHMGLCAFVSLGLGLAGVKGLCEWLWFIFASESGQCTLRKQVQIIRLLRFQRGVQLSFEICFIAGFMKMFMPWFFKIFSKSTVSYLLHIPQKKLMVLTRRPVTVWGLCWYNLSHPLLTDVHASWLRSAGKVVMFYPVDVILYNVQYKICTSSGLPCKFQLFIRARDDCQKPEIDS